MNAVRPLVWTALAATIGLAPALALTPLPESCVEADGRTSTLWEGWGERFILVNRWADGDETTLVDCGGTTELRATQNTDSKMGTYDVFTFAMQSTKRFSMNDIAGMLRTEGHEANLVRVNQRSCMCEVAGQ